MANLPTKCIPANCYFKLLCMMLCIQTKKMLYSQSDSVTYNNGAPSNIISLVLTHLYLNPIWAPIGVVILLLGLHWVYPPPALLGLKVRGYNLTLFTLKLPCCNNSRVIYVTHRRNAIVLAILNICSHPKTWLQGWE